MHMPSDGDDESTRHGTPVSTLILTFEKAGPARWLGHLDIMRAFERALRRARVPVALTQGHNPRPRLRFVFPAAVGLVARADRVFADVHASDEPVTTERINACMPPGLLVTEVTPVTDLQAKQGPAYYGVAEYRITLATEGTIASDTASSAASSLLEAAELPVTRSSDGRPREVDVRPFLVSAECESAEPGKAVFVVRARFGNAGTVRPNELAEILAGRLPGAEPDLVERTQLIAEAA
jgi:radical SAM-linked protein